MASFLDFLGSPGAGLLGGVTSGQFPESPYERDQLKRLWFQSLQGGVPIDTGADPAASPTPFGGSPVAGLMPGQAAAIPSMPSAPAPMPAAPVLPDWMQGAQANAVSAPPPPSPPPPQQQFPMSLAAPNPGALGPVGTPPAAMPQQDLGFGDRLRLALAGLSNPAAGLTYGAARQSGLTHPQAMLAAANPEALGTLTPKFQIIGKDIGGNEQYGWVNPLTQTVSKLPENIASNLPRDADGNPIVGQMLQAHLNKTQPEAGAMVAAIVRGDASVTPRNLQRYMPYAELVDPTLRQFNYDVRKKTALDFTSGGKSFENVKKLETVGGHMEKMMSLYENLGNTWSPDYNSFKNWLAVKGGKGDVAAFETAANGVSNEMGGVFRSIGMSEQDIKSWRDKVGTSQSPEQFRATMATMLDMLKTRKEALLEQYASGGSPRGELDFFPKLDAAMGRIAAIVAGRPSGPQTPAMTAAPYSQEAIAAEIERRKRMRQQ